MSETLDTSPSQRDAWNEPIRGRREPVSLRALVAMGLTLLMFADGPMRWLPIVRWLDPFTHVVPDHLLSVLSLFLLLPCLVLCYVALFQCKLGRFPDRLLCWLALLICYFSLLCWFGLIAVDADFRRDVFRWGIRIIMGLISLHLALMAGESRAGAWVAGLILFVVIFGSMTSVAIDLSWDKARRVAVGNNLKRYAFPLQHEEITGENALPVPETLALNRYFQPKRAIPSNRSLSDSVDFRTRASTAEWELWNLQYEQAAAAAAER